MSDKESTCCSSLRKNPRTETEHLIREVRARRCLWDRSDADYRNRARKDHAWVEVMRALEPKYDDLSRADKKELALVITRKWNNVRDCYKKSRFGSSRSAVLRRPYIYADLLTFLNAVYDPLQRARNDDPPDDHDDNDQEDNDQEDEWLSEVFVDMDGTAQDSTPSAAKRPRTDFTRTKESSDTDDGIVSVLVKLIEKEEDEDRAFFKSITPAVKSLPEEDKILFRIQVMKLLNSFKNRDRMTVKREIISPESETD